MSGRAALKGRGCLRREGLMEGNNKDRIKNIDTVIFDMDGTLYDTESIYKAGWLAAGVPLAVYQSFIGTSSSFINETLTANGLDAAEIVAAKVAYTENELSKGVPIKDGALTALIWLKERGYKTAIATSSTVATAQRYLEATGMAEYFDKIVSGNQLERGKPCPDIFLMAAGELGSSPEKCMVAEDSFNGVRAGNAAGMYTVMIPDLIQPDEEIKSLADELLTTLAGIPDLLDTEGSRADYEMLAEQIRSLAEAKPHWLPVMANTAAALFGAMDNINWAGFYLADQSGGGLTLGPFQGKTACISIARGKGVCGTALLKDEVIAVPDVHRFPGHIACDSASRSEIVLPVRAGGRTAAVLDIDSPVRARFTQRDREGLERIVHILEETADLEGCLTVV